MESWNRVIQRLKCLLYTVYDWSKSTWVISKLFYGGEKFTHFEDITVQGLVQSVQGGSTDGDWTFDVVVLGKQLSPPGWNQLHCEVTPCYPIPQSTLSVLQKGTVVRVSGTRTYDPPHLGNTSHYEIHPVKSLEIIG